MAQKFLKVHLAGGVKKAVEIVGIVKGFLVVFVLNGIKKLVDGVVVESIERKRSPTLNLLLEILLNQRLRD